MSPEPTATEHDSAPRTQTAGVRPAAAVPDAELRAYENCLLAMARAVENVGMYGPSHPTAREMVNEWSKGLAPLTRTRGQVTLDSDGHTPLINGTVLTGSLTNPVVLALLRRLYTTRAGRLEFLSGFNLKSAGQIAEFLAAADATRLADEEHSFDAWVTRNRIRHVRISPLRLLEVKEGDRIVSGDRQRPAEPKKPSGERPKPAELAAWASEFSQDADRMGQRAAVSRKGVGMLVAFMRGLSGAAPAGMADQVAQAAANSGQLADLILKSALVQQELAQRFQEPVGDDVVACLRAVLNALQETEDGRTEEGWRNVARTLSALETCILERLQALADGTEKDAEVIRRGVRTMHYELEGSALKREYERKRSALLAVEQRIRKFFGLESRETVDTLIDPARNGA